MELNITREEVLNLAAQKLADQYASNAEVDDIARSLISERVTKQLGDSLKTTVDSFLAAEMEKLRGRLVRAMPTMDPDEFREIQRIIAQGTGKAADAIRRVCP